ncbi:MAG: efflux RND transporter permease subunit [Myxococcota bacterium]
MLDAVRALSRGLPEATIVGQQPQQGPARGRAPVELHLAGADLAQLQAATEAAVRASWCDVPGARDVRHDPRVGVPTLAWTSTTPLPTAAASPAATSPWASLARPAARPPARCSAAPSPSRCCGSPDGERTRADAPGTTTVAAPGRPGVPLPALAADSLRWAPAAVHRVDRHREVTVRAELADGATAARVVAAAAPALAALDLPGVALDWGGEAEGSSEANGALLRTVPVGLGLLLLFLLLEFDSFRRVGIVLVTVPLAAAGVVPGLALSGQPFGFMSLLGVIALVGIVVNNAIVLLDLVDARRAAGDPDDEALVHAVRVRTRPILLTTGTTVAGMLPLALSASPLWPPLAWAMISGLGASTALTLVAVPALYRLWVAR